jgi:predicted membrane-bound spermidine synthase
VSDLSHGEFVAAYRAGRVRVYVDRGRAASFVSTRLLLPFVLLPLLGAGVALALIGFIVTGLALIAAAFVVRHLVRASSQAFVLSRSIERAGFYRDALAAEALRVEEVNGR